MIRQQAIRQRGTRGPDPDTERHPALGRLSKARGHGLLWGLLGLAGLSLSALALVLFLPPKGPSPGEKAEQVGQDRVPAATQDPVPAIQGAARAIITEGDVPGGDASAPATPEQLQAADTVSPFGPISTSAESAPNPSVDFENAPGVLSTSLRTRRKEALKAYPTEALGAIALGLEDLRLTPSSKAGRLEVNLGEQIRYEQKDHEVPKQSRRLLDGIGRLLAENPDTQVQIHSHTDDEGDAGFNLRLSQRRADAVKEYLVGRGVGAERIAAQGRGEEAPLVATGKRTPTRAERAKNRRTELVIESIEAAEQGPADDEAPRADAATTLTAAQGARAD
jgi:outer membrane protein OmpA-like peptidoglycan-associated protein